MTSFDFPGKYYEIMRGDFRDIHAETEFLSALVPAGGRVLDIGCGTGTNLRELGARGFSGLGIDQSERFIRYARDTAAATGARMPGGTDGTGVGYAHERAETFTTDERFDLVYSVFMTLNYLPRADLRQLLRKMRELLLPGGHVVLEFGHLLNFVEGFQPHTVAHHRGPDGILITRLARQSVNPHAANWRSEETLLVRERDGRVALYDNFYDQAVLTGPEVRELLTEAGLRVRAEYGGFRKEPVPFHGRGPLVIVATAAEEADHA
ncbi:class I SAM-dependent methyltransferase [Streptomyces sp. NPDC090025]|uniref:class I SAM-dependent methyltransferase n=1 Tax=Streptomyces sp. NPDC090025 TaxID=3365922 RepID=UPI003836F68C